MILKGLLLVLTLLGSGTLLGCVGQCYNDTIEWEYHPKGFPLSIPQGWISIGLGHIAAEWIYSGFCW